VEGLWSSIKRLCKDFAGINISNFDKLAENGINYSGLNLHIIISLYFNFENINILNVYINTFNNI